ncbi:hypothetical protein ASG31_08460 [Chryseobacterium sp. Leaf404]|uniref:hypothetical protein n=1 Tax=unclassified Chryseobacterium TaxID=2593645 RepID=UPI0006F41BBF|nr:MULTISPECIES: hypothetical protein [unclassified Chryseobacterium]KQT17433.1 hypothetical protein ASG31_08460 [Chryseobacterium sp. Leaf404]
MEATILNRQSLLDIAIQHTGSVLNTFQIAFENNISITDELPTLVKLAGTENKEIKNFLKLKKISPASDFDINVIEIKPLGGVGYWEIEKDFEVQ